ncbi:MAG: hypothetical protein IM537_15630 [Pseudanabaena sp. M57BS1SP1A06MG]|jgi:hypothetical protein|nr:hypothetical protein [Pseudanabaena sp. M53BS1SP1A06MG]MCA6584722.1 hypothetical protein [Pseudanabaena sp. M34BS1SP1A06MG]MCA6594535.1 hypothetical protein [Pseudanabaena sp. M38BS1SP1A06MG]MCA6601594.1 hypothetical protein [Pseudanabaena sp. M57BS1SP1A06MG]
MKSMQELSKVPAGMPLLADDIVEFHAARLLLLLKICGTNGRVEGLTKLAKLDFFVRYPEFFNKAAAAANESIRSASKIVESSMVRYHYGPWDKRYYEIIAYLRSRGLIQITQKNNTYIFQITSLGEGKVKLLKTDSAYKNLCEQMNRVKSAFGKKAGSTLKNMIYKIFQEEVTNRTLDEVIEQ